MRTNYILILKYNLLQSMAISIRTTECWKKTKIIQSTNFMFLENVHCPCIWINDRRMGCKVNTLN
jgi:hypothetical protein